MPRSTANYLTLDANGRVGAEFSGHIIAEGVDLDASTDAAIPEDDKVRWLREGDGAYVAFIGAQHVASRSALTHFVRGIDGNRTAVLTHDTQAQSGTQAQLTQTSDPTSNANTKISGVALGPSGINRIFTLMDGDGKSTFPQFSGALNRNLLVARFDGFAPVSIIADKTGFVQSITRLATGFYRITHVTAPSGYMTGTATPETIGIEGRFNPQSATQFDVEIMSGGANVDDNFSVVALG